PLTLQTDTIIHVSCFGAADGAISIEVEGGLPPYSFFWEGPDGFTSADSNIANLAAGTYDLTLTDQLDSTASLSVLIEQPDLLEASWITENVTCFQGSDGSIEFLSPTGGSGNYEFSIDGGESWDNTLLFAGLQADTFDLRMRDEDIPTCELALDSSVVITQASDFSSTFTFLFAGDDIELNDGDTICAGIEATRIYLQSTEGNAPLEIVYSVNDGMFTDTFTNSGVMPEDEAIFILAFGPGPFEVILISITDENGCPSLAQEGFTFYVDGQFADGNIFSDPDSVSVESGSQFEVTFIAEISGCDAVNAIFLEMNFDPDFLEVVSIDPLDWGTGESQDITTNIDNLNGSFSFQASQDFPPNPFNTSFEFATVTFEAKQTTGDSVTMLEYIQDLFGGTEIFGMDTVNLGPLENIPVQIFGCDEFEINTASDLSCFGESDGSAEVVSVSGGTAPYSFLWNTGDTTQAVDSLAAGIYTVTISDAEGCTDTASVTVNERDSITITVIVEDATCFGGEGTLSINGAGASQSFFTFTVNDESIGGSSGFMVISRPPGEYEIVGTANVNECQKTAFAIINQPDSIQFNELITDPLCHGENGTIEFNPTGGTGSIDVTLDGMEVSSPLSLPDGSYTLVATDSLGCMESVQLEITEPDQFEFATVLVGPECPGDLWSFTFFAGGGTGQTTFTLNGDTIDAPLEFEGLMGDSIQLEAGEYIFAISDENECSITISELTLVDDPPIDFPVQVLNPPCFGADGLIFGGLLPPEGQQPQPPFLDLIYYVNGDSIGTDLFFPAPAGEYLVTVEDGNGCTRDSLVVIVEPDSINLQLELTQPTCEDPQGLGIVTFDPIGGIGEITVLLGETTVNSPLSLPPGTYDLVYFDENECEDTVTVTIVQPNFVLLTLDSVINASCFGENGTIGFSATGGNGPLSFTLDGEEASSPVEVPAGNYSLIASDGVCGDTLSVTVTEPDSIAVNVISVFDPPCFGAEGSITFAASGGGSFFFQYTVNDENLGGASGSVSINRPAGEYEIVATNSEGCEGSTTVVLDQPDNLQLNATVSNPDCEGELGQIAFDPQGGTGNILVFLGDSAVSSPLNLPAGTYVFTLIDEIQCSNIDSITIEVVDPFSIQGQAFDALCHGANGLLTFSGQGGLGEINFFLDEEEVDSPLELPAGIYTIIGVASGSGCTDSVTLEVTQPDSISLSIEITDAVCFGEDGSISISASGGISGSFAFEVNGDFVGSSSVSVNLPAGEYLVSAIDPNECIVDSMVVISQPDSLVLVAIVTDAPCFGDDGTLGLSAEGGTPPYYFFIGESPVDSLVMLPAGNYAIQFEDENGCFDSGEVDIGEPDPVEATFAINGDLIQDADTFLFINLEHVSFSLEEILSGFAPLSVDYSVFQIGMSSIGFVADSLQNGSEIFNQTFDPGIYEISVDLIQDSSECSAISSPYLTFVLVVEDALFPLSGNVNVLSACAGRVLQVSFYAAGTDELVSSQSGTLDSMGNFSIDGVIAGSYDVFVKIDGYLQKGIAGINVGENSLPDLVFDSLVAGDVNGDNIVGQSDLDALIQAYNTLIGDAGFNAAADFNCDGKVDINDLTKLIENFGETGDIPGQL
ncbi:MAG: hypothetical protein EA409_08985, partial [Saprospirales bacterium]